MDRPNVVHPTVFEVGGIFIELRAYRTLTDDEARQFALAFVRQTKFRKKDRGKKFSVELTVGLER
jgi:hypothetical protein